ncbi:MAG: LIC_13387 family protein [Terriglobales bacterium]
MQASVFYRIAAVLLLLLDAGHTSGFPWSDPAWGVDLGAMRSTHFNIAGSSRTYWDFYVGFGLLLSLYVLLAVVLVWHLGGLPPESLARMRGTRWTFALCFAAITVVSWKHLFIIPVVFAAVITLCLTAAAWLSPKPASGLPLRQ